MICPTCRVKMDYLETSVDKNGIEVFNAFWQCPECGICVDENNPKFKYPSLIEKIEAKRPTEPEE